LIKFKDYNRGLADFSLIMLLSGRSLLSIFLVTLQLLAPWVHAHADQGSSHFGFHLPELETYGSTDARLSEQAALCFSSADTLVFAIADGFAESRAITCEHQPDGGLSLLPYRIYITTAEHTSFKDYPQLPLDSPMRPLSLSPRAPPAA
jgi:hypothetical protein